MDIKNVVVAGGGVLGSQIAFQAAYCGFNVTIWLRSEASIGRTQPKLDNLKKVYIDTINLMATKEGQTPQNWANGIADFETFDKDKCSTQVESAYNGIKLELDMKKAVADSDLVIESMAEHAIAVKICKIYRKSGKIFIFALCKLYMEKQYCGNNVAT